jgi:hypothetical protein
MEGLLCGRNLTFATSMATVITMMMALCVPGNSTAMPCSEKYATTAVRIEATRSAATSIPSCRLTGDEPKLNYLRFRHRRRDVSERERHRAKQSGNR